MKNLRKPIIGITLDWQEEGTFSPRPHYALREHYFNAVQHAGGLPLAIPHHAGNIEEYLEVIDGLLVPGGEFASPEEWYVSSNDPMVYESSPRMEFDKAILEQALAQDIAVLGICAGMQFLGCIHGCKMTKNVHSFVETTINHWDAMPCEEIAHAINIEQNTLLSKIIRMKTAEINSHHQEALVEIAEGVVVNAIAPDGVIEGIELPAYHFALGVQWHPEYEIANCDKEIFNAFIKAASRA